MAGGNSDHWNDVYRCTPAENVSWFEPTPGASLDALRRGHATHAMSLIDVGGGASTLADHLLDRGWRDLTVLDISPDALEISKLRLGGRADMVEWQVADIAGWTPPRRYDIWHDRAVFHFLIEPESRAAYKHALQEALKSGGLAIIATFAAEGPEQCSGLLVRRYNAEGLGAELGESFDLIAHWTDVHQTPAGKEQPFTWAIFRNQTRLK